MKGKNNLRVICIGYEKCYNKEVESERLDFLVFLDIIV